MPISNASPLKILELVDQFLNAKGQWVEFINFLSENRDIDDGEFEQRWEELLQEAAEEVPEQF